MTSPLWNFSENSADLVAPFFPNLGRAAFAILATCDYIEDLSFFLWKWQNLDIYFLQILFHYIGNKPSDVVARTEKRHLLISFPKVVVL